MGREKLVSCVECVDSYTLHCYSCNVNIGTVVSSSDPYSVDLHVWQYCMIPYIHVDLLLYKGLPKYI